MACCVVLLRIPHLRGDVRVLCSSAADQVSFLSAAARPPARLAGDRGSWSSQALSADCAAVVESTRRGAGPPRASAAVLVEGFPPRFASSHGWPERTTQSAEIAALPEQLRIKQRRARHGDGVPHAVVVVTLTSQLRGLIYKTLADSSFVRYNVPASARTYPAAGHRMLCPWSIAQEILLGM